MRRCDFTSIPSSYHSFDEEDIPALIKRETSSNSFRFFRLPGDILVDFEQLVKASNAANGISSSSSSDESDTIASSALDQLTSQSTCTPITIISSKEDFIHYELSPRCTSIPSPTEGSIFDLISTLEAYTPQSLYLQQVLELLRMYHQATECVKTLTQTDSFAAEVEQLLSTIGIALHQVTSSITAMKTSAMKFFTYTVYVIDVHNGYKEHSKGLSQSLSNFFSGSQSAFIDHLLRFGDHTYFEAPSQNVLALSQIQSILRMQNENNFSSSVDKGLTLCRFDGKKYPVTCQSSILPLSKPVISSKPIYYAYIQLSEIVFESENDYNLIDSFAGIAATSSATANLNTSCLPSMLLSSHQLSKHSVKLYEHYLKSCIEFQEKYYSQGSQRKKRYRKTKAEVEKELQYYLQLNFTNIIN